MVHACVMLPNLQVYKYVSISWWEAPLLVPEHEHAKRSPQRLWMPGRIYLIHHRPGGWWQASPFNWFVFCQKFARSTGVQMLTHYHVFKTCLAWKFRPVHLEELLLWNGEVHFTGGFQGCVQWVSDQKQVLHWSQTHNRWVLQDWVEYISTCAYVCLFVSAEDDGSGDGKHSLSHRHSRTGCMSCLQVP